MNVLSTRPFALYLQTKMTWTIEYKDLDVSADGNVRYTEPRIDHDIIISSKQFGYDPINSVGFDGEIHNTMI